MISSFGAEEDHGAAMPEFAVAFGGGADVGVESGPGRAAAYDPELTEAGSKSRTAASPLTWCSPIRYAPILAREADGIRSIEAPRSHRST
jgi:hypothetical protein